jgi:poly-gamma-glutamate capsule biosynthesis protein CapA/YwtB (metallophosphatase superfamily)
MRGIALIVRAGAVVCASAFLFSLLVHGAPRPAVASSAASQPSTATSAKAAAEKRAQQKAATRRAAAKVPPGVVAIVATGDIVMGSTPNLPPDGGRSFFSDVQTDLAGDVVLGNLEGTLSSGGSSKCGPSSTSCFAFQTPPSYARWLVRAGFTVMNLANNHAYDFGSEGLQETIDALDRVGLLYTGRPNQITVQKVGRIRVATVGFAPYPWAASLTDIAAAQKLVRAADRVSDVVVVTMHAGAEGRDRQHVRPGTERFLGENRGDSVRFTHAVVDAGADLVVGSGPHVLRGMEWYKGRLIAYSLGNFAGYDVFSLGGALSTSAILRVTLDGAGRFETGQLVPTHMVGAGMPALDPSETAHGVVRTLSREDFGARGVKVSREGVLSR